MRARLVRSLRIVLPSSACALARAASRPASLLPTAALALAAAWAGCIAPAVAAGGFERRNEVVQAVEKVGPAIVNISAEKRLANPFYNDPWGQFFRDFFEGGRQQPRVENSLGSGVLIDPAGYILTNEHVIASASRVKVTLLDNRDFWAEIVGTSDDADLAVLKIQSKEPLPSVPLGSSDDLMVGETLIAIGNPFGLSNTVTVGVASALHRHGQSGERVYSDFIQTDAAINPGNSGGALLNINGELVGINTAIIGQAQGIGFAIPIDRAKAIYRELVQYGEVRPVFLGLEVQELDPETARDLGLKPKSGLLVTKSRGPAAAAGVKAGDVIVQADQARIQSGADFSSAIGRKNVGDTLALEVERGGAKQTLRVQAVAFPVKDYAWQSIGIAIGDIPEADRPRREVPDQGVVVTSVRPDGPAARKGLRAGDYIIQVLDAGVASAADFNKLIPRIASLQRGSLFLRVVRDGYIAPVSLRLD